MRRNGYNYYLIFGTRLIRCSKKWTNSQYYEEYKDFEWKKMKNQNEVFFRRNGIDRSESSDSPYWIGSSSIMDTIEEINEDKANAFLQKYERAYLKHKSDYFVDKLYDNEKEYLRKTGYDKWNLSNLFTVIEESDIMEPIDYIYDCLLSDIQLDGEEDYIKLDKESFKLSIRLISLIEKYEEIYELYGKDDFNVNLKELINESTC